MTFGDYDPDDAWQADDPVPVLLAVLGRRVLWLLDHRDQLDDRLLSIAADLARLRDRLVNGER